MKNEGRVDYSSKRYGPGAFMRRKQWWYFEGLDESRQLYFVFLALEASLMSYVSLKVIDYGTGQHWSEDHFGRFSSAFGDQIDLRASGSWGKLIFTGNAEEGWKVEVETPMIQAKLLQHARVALHSNNLLTKRIDYSIRQYIDTDCEGSLAFKGASGPFSGHGYHEHNWGVQPRHSTAHWLHFWTPECAGVVLSCHYDEGLAHHYSFLAFRNRECHLYSPAEFRFDPSAADTAWSLSSPDLSLDIVPLFTHRTRIRVPKIFPYVDVDYYEQLLRVKGRALIEGKSIPLEGIGKLDFNWNKW